jgi:hypothetical protein
MICCSICKRELTAEESVLRGIGPVCLEKRQADLMRRQERICDYDLELLRDEKILIIHKRQNLDEPTISLTNCVELVILKIQEEHDLEGWTIVQHSSVRSDLFGGYDHYDLVEYCGAGVFWRYFWHSDASQEQEPFSQELLKRRVKAYRSGHKKLIEL